MIPRMLSRLRRRVPQPAAEQKSPQTDLWRADPKDRDLIERAMPYTITGVPRLQATVDAARYCVRRGIPGAFAECGVWLGGSVLAMLLTLQKDGAAPRDVYLYDTFEGMTEPTEADTSRYQESALEIWQTAREAGTKAFPEFFENEQFTEDGVRQVVESSGYPSEHLHLVPGKVEETLPEHAPEQLALLRLDTDWYESTRHELEHLYPRLSPGGVLIIDDYGHWEGARRAVDEYFSTQAEPLLFTRVDYTAVMATKH
jgi:O-methyltransferase